MNWLNKKTIKFFSTGFLFYYKILVNRMRSYLVLFPFRKFIKKLKIRRIHRDAFLVGTLTGYIIELILDKKLSRQEYKRLYLSGALTHLYDKLFDDSKYDSKYLQKITRNPDLADDDNNYERCYKCLYISLLKMQFKNGSFTRAIKKIYESQLESRRQEYSITEQELEKITYEKGGSASLFYACSTDIEFDEYQTKIIYWFGVLVQLLDDIFDVGRDLNERHNTLASINICSPEIIKNRLLQVLDSNLKEVISSDLKKYKKKKLTDFYMFFTYPAFAYIDYLERCSITEEIITNGELKEKYYWNGWNTSNVLKTFSYIKSN